MGAKAPDIPIDNKIETIFREAGKNFAMYCYTQAYPIPIFR